MKKVKPIFLTLGLALAMLCFLLNPFILEMKQNFLLSGLLLTVYLWASSALHKSLASAFLLLLFTFFGMTPFSEIIAFSYSPTMLLIISTTLLSVGMMKTKIMEKPIELLLRKSGRNKLLLLTVPYLLGTLLIFLIPQAFSRVVILGTIFHGLLQAVEEKEIKAKQALLFNCFLALTMSCMFFSNGDIVLNHAALSFAGKEIESSLGFVSWFKYMFLPSFAASVSMLLVIYGLFRKELSGFSLKMIKPNHQEVMTISKKKQTIALITMIIVVAFWMSSAYHGVSPWIFASLGVLVFYAVGILKLDDLHSVNPHFLLFFTAAMSIGKVLGQSGVGSKIFLQLEKIIPLSSSWTYLPVLALVVMGLHMLIGSSVATMSVVLPILLPMAQQGGYRGEAITLMVYILVNIHFLLPFHHATMMIGEGKGYYPDQYMLRLGMVMSVLSLVFLVLFYFPWWRVMGIL